jgi:hypothetical protein
MNLSFAAHMAFLLAPLIACGFPQQTFHAPGISNILKSSLMLRHILIALLITLSGLLPVGIQTLPYIARVPRPSLKSGWKPHDLITLAWMMPSYAASVNGSQAHLHHGCNGFWSAWVLSKIK